MVRRTDHEVKAVELAIEQLVELAGGPSAVTEPNGSAVDRSDEAVGHWVRAILFDGAVGTVDAVRYVERAVDSLRSKGASYSLPAVRRLIHRDVSDPV